MSCQSSVVVIVAHRKNRYNTDPGSVFVEHANEMEKKQFRVMKRVPETDLTPYKEQILAENQSSLMSPAIPRMSVSNMNLDAAAAAASAAAGSASASAAAGASPQVLPTAPSVVVPQVPALKVTSLCLLFSSFYFFFFF